MNPSKAATQEGIADTAAALAGEPIRSAVPARPGGNNRIFKVETASGATFALKFYPQQDADPRDRLGAEWTALQFLAANDLGPVPAAIAVSPGSRCALYGWAEGARPASSVGSVEQLAAFFNALQGKRSSETAGALPFASAACLSAAAAIDQFTRRRARLDDAATENSALRAFLANDLDPVARQQISRCENGIERRGLSMEAELKAEHRCLSPSDFGLHNALADINGQLTFLDFEYFGWDDPVKAVSDVVLHPGSEFSAPLASAFLQGVVPPLAERDPEFLFRLSMLSPIFTLIWCLIILNEFLPERWARRRLAGQTDDHAAALSRQLQKAAACLKNTDKLHDLIPKLP